MTISGRISRHLRLATLLWAAVLALGACGGAKGAGSPAGAATGAASAKAASTPSAETSQPSPGGTVKSEASTFPTTAGGEDRRCLGVRFVSNMRGEANEAHIWARPDVVPGWHCDNIVPGRQCMIGWNGQFAGLPPENHIRFVAWEHGKHEPVLSTDVGPLPLEGQFTAVSTKFAYVVGKTDKVRFYLQLLDANKVPIATSDTFVYNVNCKG